MVLEFLAEFIHAQPLIGIILLSIAVTFFSLSVTMLLTNKTKRKELKDKQKACQELMKVHKGNPEKMMEAQKELMACSMEQMRSQFKPMLVTLIPILLLFSWANAHIAYMPITPQQEFATMIEFAKDSQGYAEISVPEGIEVIGNKTRFIEDNQASWILKGEEGSYTLNYNYNSETASKEVIITSGIEYITPSEKPDNANRIKTITVQNEKQIYLNIFGWKLGWIGTYIIFSLISSIFIRKLLKL